ncbi:cytochrome P450, partial [Mycobacterium sp.]|uniref:cytochrome P450 n=1 Tax=Mycobacterium sp. TaxID=1785 RepID=UPI0012890184
RYLRTVFAHLRRYPGDDIISAMLVSRDGGTVTDQELFWLSLMLLVAGNETTTNLIGSLLVALAENPTGYQRLRADPALIDSAIEEAVRWSSPVQHLYRMAAADYTVGSTTIPAGSRVLLLFAAANRDPRKYPDPDVFDIGRNAGDHLGFGSGIHHCLGAKLARLETRVVLEELLPRVRRIHTLGPVVWHDNPTVHGPRRLLLHLER